MAIKELRYSERKQDGPALGFFLLDAGWSKPIAAHRGRGQTQGNAPRNNLDHRNGVESTFRTSTGISKVAVK